jgi:formamidopyrimidine-DNA glycosylase
MPELPEVQALSDYVTTRAAGRVIAGVDVVAFSALKTFDPPLTALTGQPVREARRRGKFLDIVTGTGPAPGETGPHLVIHLARGGWLRWRDELPIAPPRPGRGPLAVRVRLVDPATGEAAGGFDLTESGTQKRLACYVVAAPEQVPGIARLGPDPLAADFGRDDLARLLAGSRTRLKGLLRDQQVIAGIGNAYSDEVLHAARLSPFKLGGSLDEAQVTGLYEAIVEVLRDAVERSRGLAAADVKGEKKLGMRVHGRTGEPCPVCGTTIREVSFADSSLQYCPRCQTGDQVLADRRLSRLLK